MRYIHALKFQTLSLYALVLPLVFIIACGSTAPAAPEPTAAPAAEPTAAPIAGETPQPTSATVAQATPTPPPPSSESPSGILTAGLPELGRFSGHPAEAVLPSLPR